MSLRSPDLAETTGGSLACWCQSQPEHVHVVQPIPAGNEVLKVTHCNFSLDRYKNSKDLLSN